MSKLEFRVDDGSAGVRLDRFLAGAAGDFSRARIQDLIKSGHVSLNGSTAKASVHVRAGDEVVLDEPPPAPTETLPEEIALDVLYEDSDLIVINKPAGLVVHPAAGHWSGTLVNALLHHCHDLGSSIASTGRPAAASSRPRMTPRIRRSSGSFPVAK